MVCSIIEIKMKKLSYFLQKDPRIKAVWKFAKQKYQEANLPQHNWEHILRDLYRALVIAEAEKGVDFKILIPAVLLHDIGVTEGEYSQHEEIGSKIAKRMLPKFGYSPREIKEIVHCIQSHGGKVKPTSIEAMILFDADRLEKAGAGGLFALYRVQQELGIPLEVWIERAIRRVKKFRREGFYTKKAKEICGDGFKETLEHLEKVQRGLQRRKDFLITEEKFCEG